MRESKKSEGGAFKAPPGSYRVKDKCTINNTHSNEEFWKITKPFMSHKGSSANTNISLIENDAIINN